jgi:hypothetical protein
VNIQTKQTIYKLKRLNDERYTFLRKNCILISEDYLHLFSLSMDKDVIYSSFSKMFVALKELFGDSGKYYDDWKGSFSFPFIISFKKAEEEFQYIMNIYNIRASIEFNIAKLIQADDERFERDVIHEPFEEFPREEINYFINYLVGFLSGYFESVRKRYDEFFFHAVQSNLILFGYKDGIYFDKQYEKEGNFRNAIQKLTRNAYRQVKTD